MIAATRTFLWRLLALASLALGVVAMFLPVLPTVPFVLLAAWAASRGWPALDAWMLAHAHFGPAIRQWRAHGAVPRRAKWFATLAMSGSALMLLFVPVNGWLRAGICAVMVAVGCWLWRRPEPAPDDAPRPGGGRD